MRAALFALGFLLFNSVVFAGTTEVGQYDGGAGRTLRYVLGSPSKPSPHLFIFAEGDGHGCYVYDPNNISRLAATVSSTDYWVVPESAKQALCTSGDYKRLDFHHRVQEIKNLITELRRDARFSNVQIFLMGHSGGVDVASHVAATFSDIEGLVLIAGSSSNLETMFYTKTLLDGQKQGLPENEIQRQLDEHKQTFAKIKSNCSTNVNDWGDRSNLFWCQMLTSDIVGNLLKFPKDKKILIIHGQVDKIVPVEEAFGSYATLLANDHKVQIKTYPNMDHSFFPVLNDVIQVVTAWAY